MSLLSDFKTMSGATEGDQFIIDYYLAPAINRASSLSNNKKRVEITLTSGTNSYNLTSSAVASPVVSSAGIQELSFDDAWNCGYRYKDEFYLSNPTTLYFVDASNISGTIAFNYYAYYTIPTLTPTETDAPTKLFPAIIKLAKAYYMLDGITSNAGSGTGGEMVTSYREENLSKNYASGDSVNIREGLQMTIKEAENEIKKMSGFAYREASYSYMII